MKDIEIVVKKTVPFKIVVDTLVSAFEGGSNYWYTDLERIGDRRSPYIAEDCAKRGFKLMDEDGNVYTITPDKYKDALELMCEKYPKQFDDMIKGYGDNDTADIFLQLLVLGDIVYG